MNVNIVFDSIEVHKLILLIDNSIVTSYLLKFLCKRDHVPLNERDRLLKITYQEIKYK